MKNFPLLLLSFLSLTAQGYAQSNASESTLSASAVSAQMKSGIQTQMANGSGNGNVLTASIVSQVAGPLGLSSDQKKSMNNALYEYFTEKSTFLSLQKTDIAAYQQQQSNLLTGFIKNLSGFLTSTQVSLFEALKPSVNSRPSILSIVFY